MSHGIHPAVQALQAPSYHPLQNCINGMPKLEQLSHRHNAVLVGREVLQGPKRSWRSSFSGHMPR